MPVLPGFIEKFLLLRIHRAPGFLLDLAGSQSFKALCTAHKLGIFELLHLETQTSEDVAVALDLDKRGTRILLEALESTGYVKEKKGKYSNSKIVKKWLLASSPISFSSAIPLFSTLIFEFSELLEHTIRDGKQHFTLYEWLKKKEDGESAFQASMVAPAMLSIKEVISKIKLPSSVEQILDLGGGHGLYSLELCRKYPRLRSIIYELSAVADYTRNILSQKGAEGERISVRCGNYLSTLPEDSFETVLLFNILHGNPSDVNIDLCARLSKRLSSGNRLIILEQLSDQIPGPASKAFTRLQALNLFNALGGQIYSFNEISQWLRDTGFKSIKRSQLFSSPMFGLIFATKD